MDAADMYHELITAMSSVVTDFEHNMSYQVNPDTNRLGVPHFKVYDDTSAVTADKVARIFFFTRLFILHTGGTEMDVRLGY